MSEPARPSCSQCGASFQFRLDLYEHLVNAHQWRASRTAGLERVR